MRPMSTSENMIMLKMLEIITQDSEQKDSSALSKLLTLLKLLYKNIVKVAITA